MYRLDRTEQASWCIIKDYMDAVSMLPEGLQTRIVNVVNEAWNAIFFSSDEVQAVKELQQLICEPQGDLSVWIQKNRNSKIVEKLERFRNTMREKSTAFLENTAAKTNELVSAQLSTISNEWAQDTRWQIQQYGIEGYYLEECLKQVASTREEGKKRYSNIQKAIQKLSEPVKIAGKTPVAYLYTLILDTSCEYGVSKWLKQERQEGFEDMVSHLQNLQKRFQAAYSDVPSSFKSNERSNTRPLKTRCVSTEKDQSNTTGLKPLRQLPRLRFSSGSEPRQVRQLQLSMTSHDPVIRAYEAFCMKISKRIQEDKTVFECLGETISNRRHDKKFLLDGMVESLLNFAKSSNPLARLGRMAPHKFIESTIKNKRMPGTLSSFLNKNKDHQSYSTLKSFRDDLVGFYRELKKSVDLEDTEFQIKLLKKLNENRSVMVKNNTKRIANQRFSSRPVRSYSVNHHTTRSSNNRINISRTGNMQPPLKAFAPREDIAKAFSKVRSGNLVLCSERTREDFRESMRDGVEYPAALVSSSAFVPQEMRKWLLTKKAKTSFNQKNVKSITPMMGVMSTFVTPFAASKMKGDYIWNGGHSCALVKNGYAREVIVNGAIQPDFENKEVMFRLVALSDREVQGESCPEPSMLPSVYDLNGGRRAFDQKLLQHMIKHLTSKGVRPAKDQVSHKAIGFRTAIQLLNGKIKAEHFDPTSLQGSYFKYNGDVYSLEILFNVYKEMMRNQLSALEGACPQGYVYTISPPSIFAAVFDRDATLGNRLQILAIKELMQEVKLENLKTIAFGDFADKEAVGLLKRGLRGEVPVMSKHALFSGNQDSGKGTYKPENPNWAVVIPNNSDAFGDNITNEGFNHSSNRGGSLDAVIGAKSSAACSIGCQAIIKHPPQYM